MKKLVILLFLLMVSSILFYFEIDKISGNFILEEPEKGIVTKIIDGDTLVVHGDHIRLIGIDTDERGELCYSAAKKRLGELVLNKEVVLEQDVTNKDQYKRLLRYVFIEDNGKMMNINVQMVSEGLAIARFYDDRKFREEILAAEDYARENNIGCKWANFSSD